MVIIALFVSISADAQDTRKMARTHLFSDTLSIKTRNLEKSEIFYDSLQKRNYKSWISRTLARLLIASRNTSDVSVPNTDFELSQKYFNEFGGRKISDIRVMQSNVFETTDKTGQRWVDRFVNSLHVLTNEKKLRQNLLFKVGQKLNPYNMAINEMLVRNLPYISTAFFVIVPDKDDPENVVVNIFARDSWTISGNINLGNSSWVEGYDRNFVGTGNGLSFKYYMNRGEQRDGFEGTYAIDNCWGTFANLEISAGVGATNNKAIVKASRPFILPNDHIFGFIAGYQQANESMYTIDTTIAVNKLNYAAWYGYSVNLDKRQGTNLYFTTGFDYVKFNRRPEVTSSINPYYHNRTTWLLSVGVARQNYFQGNMIYGYGRTEDIPYGYKIDATIGLQWSEFHGRRYYFSGSINWGDMTKIGYFNTTVAAATFMNDDREYYQGQVSAQLRYFSPLFRIGTHYIRQFLNVSAIWGFNRYIGEREVITYTDFANIRGMRNDVQSMGYNRFTIGSESVLFTPVFFYHFRFAFNVWGDFGWLGYKSNMFANQFASALGIGVRIKNERLIFNSISIRVGFSLKRPDHSRFNPFEITSEQSLKLNGFAPTEPKIQEYQ